MIRPAMMLERTCIKMKPHKIILGLKMPEYERMLVISAAKIAGISTIEELLLTYKQRGEISEGNRHDK